MSVELYPDHKAILHFQDSLKVYEIDFLDFLQKFLMQDAFQHRHFDIYVKPTLSHSAFDFIVHEPNRAVTIFQTPENIAQFDQGAETYAYFIEQRLYTLSPGLHGRIRHAKKENWLAKATAVVKQSFYFYQDELRKEVIADEEDEELDQLLLTEKDFMEHSTELMALFESQEKNDYLTATESHEIQQILNPNTNLKHYIQKSLPGDYEKKAESSAQTKHKFKGPENSGKTLVLTKRVINCANRLKGKGRILVIAGNIQKVKTLKDIITAEDGRSLQELGVEVSSFQELAPPKEKYLALFVDDGHYLKPEWYRYLLDEYLVDMTQAKNFEYVVMADENSLPQVPQIQGPFRTLKYDINHLHKMLSDSREIFLSILNN